MHQTLDREGRRADPGDRIADASNRRAGRVDWTADARNRNADRWDWTADAYDRRSDRNGRALDVPILATRYTRTKPWSPRTGANTMPNPSADAADRYTDRARPTVRLQ